MNRVSVSNADFRKRLKSELVYQDACKIIPGGVNSPALAFMGIEVPPLVISKGKGSLIYDIDGYEYIDYCCSWGTLILGHADPLIIQSAILQLENGTCFGTVNEETYRLAAKIQTHIPSMEKIRFVSSGTEATMAAIRLSRSYSGKPLIISFEGHYHGHCDTLFTHSQGVSKEISENTISLPFNEIEPFRKCLKAHHNDIAAVIIEPIAGNMGVIPSHPDFLEVIREETLKKNIVLIFDEVITGFRVGLSGAQGRYQILPDLTCLGPIIGGGFPLGALGGKAKIMDYLSPTGPIYQAGTMSAHPTAIASGLTTLTQLEQPNIYEELESTTYDLVEGIKKTIRDKEIRGCVNHIGSMFTPFFGYNTISKRKVLDQKTYKKLFCYLFHHGVYLTPSPYEACFLSIAHSKAQINHTLELLSSFII